MPDLQERSVRGGMVTMAAQGAKFTLTLTGTMILARLLTPADFGLVAMVMALTGFVALFTDLGLSAATIQKAVIDHHQVSTLFWCNVLIGLSLAALTAALSPAIAWFYGEPRLVRIALVIGSLFVLAGLTVQHSALLRRQMRLASIAVIDVSSSACGLLAAVALVFAGAGYWALVAMHVATALLSAALVWIMCPWRPGLPRRGSGVRTMLVFGGSLTASNLLGYCARNVDKILLGWWCGPATLGLYSRAYQLLMLPIGQVTSPLYNIIVPTLSRLQDSPQAFNRYYLRAINAIMWITGPLTACLAACSREVVLVVLGQQWAQAAILFKILAAVAFLLPIYYTATWILVSSGQTQRLLRLAAVTALTSVICFALGLPFGATGVAMSYAATFLLVLFPGTMIWAFRGTQLTLLALTAHLSCPLLISAAIYMGAEAAGFMLWGNTPVIGLASRLCGGLLFGGVFLILSPTARRELLHLLGFMRIVALPRQLAERSPDRNFPSK